MYCVHPVAAVAVAAAGTIRQMMQMRSHFPLCRHDWIRRSLVALPVPQCESKLAHSAWRQSPLQVRQQQRVVVTSPLRMKKWLDEVDDFAVRAVAVEAARKGDCCLMPDSFSCWYRHVLRQMLNVIEDCVGIVAHGNLDITFGIDLRAGNHCATRGEFGTE